MGYKKKTAREKLFDSKDLPKIEKIKPNQEKLWGKGTIVIPAPVEVDEIMKEIPKGKLITINKIREKLAKKHKTNIACPICTGIFASISANAAEEEKAEGKREITPYWRTLRSEGELNEKYPGGIESQAKHLKEEGYIIESKGKKVRVKDFEKYLL